MTGKGNVSNSIQDIEAIQLTKTLMKKAFWNPFTKRQE